MHLERTTSSTRSRLVRIARARLAACSRATAPHVIRRAGATTLGLTMGMMMLAGPVVPAFANDLSNYPCRAADVEIIGSGIVVNEPCVCPPGGTFDAIVQFTVRNHTSTGRYCIAIHLVPDGVVLTEPLDLVLRDAGGSSTAPGKSGGARYQDTIMYATIPNFSCDTGFVCFGQEGVVRGKCDPGTCTTISWNTSPGAAGCTTPDDTPPGGQCRHQQVCVIGFGASLACTSNCGLTCEGTSTLQACATAPASRGPFQFTVAGDDGSSQTQSAFGDPSGKVCLNFDVSPGLSPTTKYTLTVTDKDGCVRTATTSLNVRTKPTANAGMDEAKCSGGATTDFTLGGTATNGTPQWSVISGVATIADSSNLSTTATVTGTGSATLRLTVTNPPCPPTSDDVVLTVNALAVANAGMDQAKCSAGATTPFTLAGTASGGTATWSVVSGPVVINDPSSLTSAATFTGTGTATLRLTTVSSATPACPTVTDDVVLSVSPTAVSLTSPTSGCNGVLSYSASVPGASGCSFVWTIDGQSLATFAAGGAADDARVARASGTGDATLEFRALDNACHTIAVTATCSGGTDTCMGTASTQVKQCVGAPESCTALQEREATR